MIGQSGTVLNEERGVRTLYAIRRMLIESRFHPKNISSKEENWYNISQNHTAVGMSGQVVSGHVSTLCLKTLLQSHCSWSSHSAIVLLDNFEVYCLLIFIATDLPGTNLMSSYFSALNKCLVLCLTSIPLLQMKKIVFSKGLLHINISRALWGKSQVSSSRELSFICLLFYVILEHSQLTVL